MAKAVRKAFLEIVAKAEGGDEAVAAKRLQEMKIQQKYVEEIFV